MKACWVSTGAIENSSNRHPNAPATRLQVQVGAAESSYERTVAAGFVSESI